MINQNFAINPTSAFEVEPYKKGLQQLRDEIESDAGIETVTRAYSHHNYPKDVMTILGGMGVIGKGVDRLQWHPSVDLTDDFIQIVLNYVVRYRRKEIKKGDIPIYAAAVAPEPAPQFVPEPEPQGDSTVSPEALSKTINRSLIIANEALDIGEANNLLRDKNNQLLERLCAAIEKLGGTPA